MNPAEFLSDLLNRGIKLWAEGDQLCFRAPAGALTPEIRASLARHKPELLAFLKLNNALIDSVAPPIAPVAVCTPSRLPVWPVAPRVLPAA